MKKAVLVLVASFLLGASAMLSFSCEEAPPARVTGVLFQGGIQ
jgi:hypothetical protein